MTPLPEGYRDHVLRSTYGGVQQRWVLIASEHRRAQAQRTGGKQLLKSSHEEVKGFKKLCRTPFACEADARQALQLLCTAYRRHSCPRAQLRVRGLGHTEQSLKASVDPGEPEVHKVVETVLTPAHPDPFEALLDEPFTGTFNHPRFQR